MKHKLSSFLLSSALALGAGCARQEAGEFLLVVPSVTCSSNHEKSVPVISTYQEEVAALIARAVLVRSDLEYQKTLLAEKIKTGVIKVPDIADNPIFNILGGRYSVQTPKIPTVMTEQDKMREERLALDRKIYGITSSCEEKIDICNQPSPDAGDQLFDQLNDLKKVKELVLEKGKDPLAPCYDGDDYEPDCLDYAVYPTVGRVNPDFGELYITHMTETNACDKAVAACVDKVLYPNDPTAGTYDPHLIDPLDPHMQRRQEFFKNQK